ncbi:hypothetical protein OAG68_01705 [bacterium]|nr:hypothetical protein [bacterium]
MKFGNGPPIGAAPSRFFNFYFRGAGNLINRFFLVSMLVLVLVLLFAGNALGQTYVGPFLKIRVRIEIDGVMTNDWGLVKLRDPSTGDLVGDGEIIEYDVTDGLKTNCNGTKYNYSVVNMDNGWIGILESDSTVGVSAADTEAYWDWVYHGYEKVSGLDFTQNCHGFAFGIGDWPQAATTIVGATELSPCYIRATELDATVAVDHHATGVVGAAHSIKVWSDSCEVEVVVPGPRGEPIHHTEIQTATTIVESKEQFRESGIYRQTSECPDSVRLNNSEETQQYLFFLYKPRSGN